MTAVTEQTTEALDWKLIGFIWRGRIHWNFSHIKSMVCIEVAGGENVPGIPNFKIAAMYTPEYN